MKKSRPRMYKLVGHVVVECLGGNMMDGFMERGMAIHQTGEDPWRVAFTPLSRRSVSTVFLGLDHNRFGDEPHLFETTVFDKGEVVDIVGRCATWEQAEVQHAEAVAAAKTGHLRVVK